jgi:hypothetical protein
MEVIFWWEGVPLINRLELMNEWIYCLEKTKQRETLLFRCDFRKKLIRI